MELEDIEDWDEPPAHLDGAGVDPRHRYAEVVRKLRNNRSQWARLAPRENGTAAKSLAANIRKGRLASFAPEGAFEAKYSGVHVWVRFVGDPDGVQAKKKMVKTDPTTAKAVRTWAKATGRKVNERGQVPTVLIEEWRRATRGESHEEAQ